MNRARQLRPEFIQLREGLKAKKALVNAEKSNYYPMFFIGAKASIADASNRDKLHNPFVFDEFSHSYGAVFLGLKWGIDFGITEGKVREAEAEYKKLLEKKRFADEGIPFQVRKVYYEINEAEKTTVATESAYRNAKKWLVAAVANFDMGVGEAEEIADAIEMYAMTRVDNLMSVYNEKMSHANLYYVTGMDITEK
jgi:outer membrane protein TolC